MALGEAIRFGGGGSGSIMTAWRGDIDQARCYYWVCEGLTSGCWNAGSYDIRYSLGQIGFLDLGCWEREQLLRHTTDTRGLWYNLVAISISCRNIHDLIREYLKCQHLERTCSVVCINILLLNMSHELLHLDLRPDPSLTSVPILVSGILQLLL